MRLKPWRMPGEEEAEAMDWMWGAVFGSGCERSGLLLVTVGVRVMLLFIVACVVIIVVFSWDS